MNKTQSNREQFPGIEFKDDNAQAYRCEPTWRLRSRVFSSYQNESNLLECLKYTLSDIQGWKCKKIVVKYGGSWYDCCKYYCKDDIVGVLFDYSMSKYITKFDVSRVFNIENQGEFELWLKVHDLTPNVETNIGPNLLEYIATLF